MTHRSEPAEIIDRLAAAMTEAAVGHDTATNAWLLKPRQGLGMRPVLWVKLRQEATARELASLSSDLQDVQRRLAGPRARLPIILRVDSDHRRLTPLGLNDPLGRVERHRA